MRISKDKEEARLTALEMMPFGEINQTYKKGNHVRRISLTAYAGQYTEGHPLEGEYYPAIKYSIEDLDENGEFKEVGGNPVIAPIQDYYDFEDSCTKWINDLKKQGYVKE